MTRFILHTCMAALLGATVASAATQGDEALYQQRFAALMHDGGIVTHYEPMETVPGARHWRPLPLASTPSIRPDALNAATAYAAANNSTAFIVWRGGSVQTQSYFGVTTAGTPLLSKSLSKPLGAIAVGRAIALGKIKSLDEPVADFIPEWKGTPKATILVRHLLDMRAGLIEQSFSTDPDSPINRAYISPNHGAYLIAHYPLTNIPGSTYGYSNATADLVALLIERATGRRYAEFIGHDILAPIGAQGGEIWIDRAGGLAHSGCCMTLPVESWLRLGVLLLDDGIAQGKRLLPKGYVQAMATPTKQNPYYGLGVWVAGRYIARRGFAGMGGGGPQVLHSEPYLDKDLFLFDGNGDQTIYISRATHMVILRMGGAPPKLPEWDNAYLPNTLIDGIKWQRQELHPESQAK